MRDILSSIFVSVVILAIVSSCFGCSGQWNVPETAKEAKNPIPPNAKNLAAARRIYADRCAHCHGVNGDGKRPPGSMYLYLTQPTNFTDAKIMDGMTDGEIFWKITTGNRPMPSYKNNLSEADRWELVSFLRTFAHPQRNSVPSSAAQGNEK